MSLSLTVGYLQSRDEADLSGRTAFIQALDRSNQALAAARQPKHIEPDDLFETGPLVLEMPDPGGIHALRRIAAHLWAGDGFPPPPGSESTSDSLVQKYYDSRGTRTTDSFLHIFGFSAPPAMTFDHLVLHGDTQGLYLPVDMTEVVFSTLDIELSGGVLGSSLRLMDECEILADLLKLPLDLDPHDPDVHRAWNGPHEGTPSWLKYGTAAAACLYLHRAARHSAETGAALVLGSI